MPRHANPIVLLPGFNATGTDYVILIPRNSYRDERTIFHSADLEEKREEYGMLDSSSWLTNKQRLTNKGILAIYYFQHVADVQKFTWSASHPKGWRPVWRVFEDASTSLFET